MSKYAPWKRTSSNPAPTSTTVCQKCLGTGHFTYQCKSSRPYISRPSRTQMLENPRVLAKLKAEGKPSVDVPEEFKKKSGTANKILEDKEKARAKESESKNGEPSRKRRRRSRSSSESSSDSDSDESSSGSDKSSESESDSDSSSDSSGSDDSDSESHSSRSRSSSRSRERDQKRRIPRRRSYSRESFDDRQ